MLLQSASTPSSLAWYNILYLCSAVLPFVCSEYFGNSTVRHADSLAQAITGLEKRSYGRATGAISLLLAVLFGFCSWELARARQKAGEEQVVSVAEERLRQENATLRSAVDTAKVQVALYERLLAGATVPGVAVVQYFGPSADKGAPIKPASRVVAPGGESVHFGVQLGRFSTEQGAKEAQRGFRAQKVSTLLLRDDAAHHWLVVVPCGSSDDAVARAQELKRAITGAFPIEWTQE